MTLDNRYGFILPEIELKLTQDNIFGPLLSIIYHIFGTVFTITTLQELIMKTQIILT